MQEATLLVKLMRYALRQDHFELKEEFDSAKLAEMIRDQNLVSFVCPALQRIKDERLQSVANNLAQEYNEELHRILVQQMEMESLLYKLEDSQMDCLPLKGYFMKDYYPESTFRSMTDFDVLIREFDEKQIQALMENIVYCVEEQGDEHHDVYVKKPYMVAEMHKNLSDEKVEREIPQIDKWLENAWDRCILTQGKLHTYEMTEEDLYIYHLIHLYKHIRHGGISVRPLVDIHVFLDKANARLDWEYLQKTLCQLELEPFEKAMKDLSRKCFETKSSLNESEMKLLEFFFDSGMFGTSKSVTTVSLVTEGGNSYSKGKFSAYFRLIFQPARILRDKYPILEKSSILLPIVWIIRCFRVVFKERQKVKHLKEASTKEEYDKMREIFQIAGIINK